MKTRAPRKASTIATEASKEASVATPKRPARARPTAPDPQGSYGSLQRGDPPPITLGIDPSLHAPGLVVLDTNGLLLAAVRPRIADYQRVGELKRFNTHRLRYERIADLFGCVRTLCARYPVSLIGIESTEGITITHANPDGTRRRGSNQVIDAMGLSRGVAWAAAVAAQASSARQLTVREYTVEEIRGWACGRTRRGRTMPKDVAIQTVLSLGYQVGTEADGITPRSDICDAILAALFAQHVEVQAAHGNPEIIQWLAETRRPSR